MAEKPSWAFQNNFFNFRCCDHRQRANGHWKNIIGGSIGNNADHDSVLEDRNNADGWQGRRASGACQ